ncbi:MAG: phytanoyl-CoA dioxygenase family protein [Pyrinomonadaceae bacterium]
MATFFLKPFSGMFMREMSIELSGHHGPITTIFDSANATEPPLSLAEVDRFQNDGFIEGVKLLSDSQIEELRRELTALMQPEYKNDQRFYEYNTNEAADPSKRLFHALGAWRVSPAFHDLIFSEPFISIAEQLLGGPVRFWHDQLFVKPAHDGAVVAWHQDYSYWTRTKPVAHLTCWIGLDDSTVENGCVHYVPGSHRWDLLPRGDLASDMDAVLDLLTAEQKAGFDPVPVELKAGEASFHHPMMLHGSYENRSNRPRRAAVINVLRDGVVSDSDEPLLAGVPVIPKGDKIGGRFFPLLSKTAESG